MAQGHVEVCHFPPGTSKWNKIEHRLFCHVTRNWRGHPLESYEDDYSSLCLRAAPNALKRLHQVLLISTFLPLCWLAMQAVHELGHVLGAVATGGRIEKVVLHPLTISRTDVSPNPRPLFVVWAGPLVGVLLPLALLIVFKAGRIPLWCLVQFFAGSCLIANGAYIGAGSFYGGDNASDPGVMLNHGSPIWCLWVFGAVSFPLGLYLWNGLGPHFGLGTAAGKVEHRAAYLSCALFAVAVILEVALSFPR